MSSLVNALGAATPTNGPPPCMSVAYLTNTTNNYVPASNGNLYPPTFPDNPPQQMTINPPPAPPPPRRRAPASRPAPNKENERGLEVQITVPGKTAFISLAEQAKQQQAEEHAANAAVASRAAGTFIVQLKEAPHAATPLSPAPTIRPVAIGEERAAGSHAARNLGQPVLPARTTIKKKKTPTTADAGNAALKEATQTVLEHKARVIAADGIRERLDANILRVAMELRCTPEKIRGKSLKEIITKIAQTDTYLSSITPNCAEAQILKDTIQEDRDLQTIGVRRSSCAVGPNYTAMAKHLQKEVLGLWTCTGIQSFCFLTKGHINNPGMPEVITSGGAKEFCLEQLGKMAHDVAVLFEAWSLMKDSEIVKPLTVVQLAAKIKFSLIHSLKGIALQYRL
ncbi:hypothetical protein CPB85DRAFT_1441629 [Mucidula mucida]|nr:hypothetical protein CPB85DRAFT_1441629 [Mucidula mucida]